MKGKATDPNVKWYRPLIVSEGCLDSPGDALKKAKKRLADGVMDSFTITAKVRGHRTSDGKLWGAGPARHFERRRTRLLSHPAHVQRRAGRHNNHACLETRRGLAARHKQKRQAREKRQESLFRLMGFWRRDMTTAQMIKDAIARALAAVRLPFRPCSAG